MISLKNILGISGVILLILSIFLFHSCKEDKPTPPTIKTYSVYGITATTATSGGNVTNWGGAEIASIGICWSTSVEPTRTDKTLGGNPLRAYFTSNITGLAANTTYYVRAYAANIADTGYGNQVSFTTLQVSFPHLTTTAITSITQTTAASGGNITTDNGGPVTSRGVCWSTSTNPAIGNSKLLMEMELVLFQVV